MIQPYSWRDFKIKQPKEQSTVAVILCAGIGERLKPITDYIPKPLMEINGKSALQYNIELLHRYGIFKPNIIINTYHLSHHFHSFTKDVVFSYEPHLKGTAGALKKVEKWLSNPFIVMNGDTITNVNLQNLLNAHKQAGNIATVFTHHDAIHTGGIYVFDKIVLSYIPPHEKYSIKDDLIPRLLKEKKDITLFKSDDYYFDIGTLEGLKKAKEFFEN